jgi:AraC family transcriptional regulator
MDVQIVVFPETRVAAVEHFGSPALEHDTARKLIAWKLEHRLLDPLKHRYYGVHYTDPRTTPPSDHHVDFCLSIDSNVGPNAVGIIDKVIPRSRCALARDIGSRYDNQAAVYLYEQWLPRSGELPGDFPIFFHYINVGPGVREADMITDVYLPLK